VLLGLSFALTLTSGVFGAVLAALHRFDLLAAVQVSQTLVRVTGIVWALRSGYGIVALALWELLLALGAGVGLTLLALKQYPQLRFAFKRPASAVLGQLWNYSLYILIFNSAAQIIYYTDNVVVGAFVSAGAVTFFAIAGGLLEYARQIVSGLGLVLFPLASSLDADKRHGELQSLLINGTRATLLIALPIQATLFFRGHTFISLWIGAEQAQVSGTILQILLVAHLFAIANYTSFTIVCGLGKHKPVAVAASTEAIANLVLSIILVRQMGLEGVAWGTVIPSLAIQLLFWPRYISSILNISTWRYLSEGWVPSACTVVPFGLASFLADRFWPPANLAQFFFQTAVLAPVFLLSAVVAFRDQISGQLRTRIKSLSTA
jgi:O-antigen/teichoic acid export membrane protein